MTYTAHSYDEFEPLEPPPARSGLVRVLAWTSFGFCVVAAAATLVAVSRSSNAALPPVAGLPGSTAPGSEDPGVPVADITAFPSSGFVSATASWMFHDGSITGGSIIVASAPIILSPDATGPEALDGARQTVLRVPLPQANPLMNARLRQLTEEGERDALEAELRMPPVPERNPLGRDRRELASLPPSSQVPTDTPPPAAPRGQVSLPGPTDRYAIYDITAKVVYMPSGERLEAHSGYGEMFDDPRHVSKKMVGPTPPNVYELYPREALFHGVEALRMRPIGNGTMYGRDGLLTHTYLLGSRGDSNGCVSFKEYDKFLEAYKRGEVKRLVVVASLPGVSPAPSNANPLLSWLMPKNPAPMPQQ